MEKSSKQAINDFKKIFNSLTYTLDRYTVFDDFLTFSLLMLDINKTPEMFKDLESRYKAED